MNKKILFILAFITVCSVGFCETIVFEKRDIKVDEKSIFEGITFKECVLACPLENTVIPGIKNCHFEKSYVRYCVLDGSNTFDEQSLVRETRPVPEKTDIEEKQERIEQLEKFITDNSLEVPERIEQLEKFITDNSLEVPEKVVAEEVVSK